MKAETKGLPRYESLPRIGVERPNGSKPGSKVQKFKVFKVIKVVECSKCSKIVGVLE